MAKLNRQQAQVRNFTIYRLEGIAASLRGISSLDCIQAADRTQLEGAVENVEVVLQSMRRREKT